jgi:hypothetical protein
VMADLARERGGPDDSQPQGENFMVVIKIQAFKGLGKSFWLYKLQKFLKSQGIAAGAIIVDHEAHTLIVKIPSPNDHDFVPGDK